MIYKYFKKILGHLWQQEKQFLWELVFFICECGWRAFSPFLEVALSNRTQTHTHVREHLLICVNISPYLLEEFAYCDEITSTEALRDKPLVPRVIRSRQLNRMLDLSSDSNINRRFNLNFACSEWALICKDYPRIWNKHPKPRKSQNQGFFPTFSLRFRWLGQTLKYLTPHTWREMLMHTVL